MSTDIAITTGFYRFLNWLETNRQRALTGVAAVAVLALVLSFYFWNLGQKKTEASQALSAITRPDPDAFLKLAQQYPGGDVAPRAVLLAAGDYFAAGRYTDAQTQFQRVLQDYPDNPFRPEAYFGVAACADAQGQTDAAIQQYKDLIERYPAHYLIPQVRSALARLYETSGKPELALPIYQQQAREQSGTTLGMESNVRLQALLAQHPELAKTSAVSTPNPNPSQTP